MEVLILGDTHGYIKWFEYVVKWAWYRGITHIIQVGDFGYYPHKIWGQDFLFHADEACKRHNINVYFVCGNHEDHESLQSYTLRDDEGFIILPDLDHIRYIPRGHTWTWGDIRFLGFGGAFSIDKEDQILRGTWHREELPSYFEVERAMDAGKVDVMITHDAPAGLVWDRPFIEMYDHICQNNRDAVREIVERAQPHLLFHGHYHKRYKTPLRLTTARHTVLVRGLGMQGKHSSLYPLKLDKSDIRNLG